MSMKLLDMVLKSSLAGAEKFVAAVLANHADSKTHECHPSLPQIAAQTSTTKRTAIRAISALEEKKIISVIRAAGRTARNVYKFDIAVLAAYPRHKFYEIKGDIDDTLGVTPCHHLDEERGDTVSPLNEIKGDIDDTLGVTPCHHSKDNPHLTPNNYATNAREVVDEKKPDLPQSEKSDLPQSQTKGLLHPDFITVFQRGCELYPDLTAKNNSFIHQWLNGGCHAELDIIPAMESIKASGTSVTSWNYFTKAIADRCATRKQPMPEGKPHVPTNRNGHAATTAATPQRYESAAQRKDRELREVRERISAKYPMPEHAGT